MEKMGKIRIRDTLATNKEILIMVTLPVFESDTSYDVSPTKIIALGLNYRDHIAESHSVKVRGFTDDIPEEPILFPKTPNVLIGHEEAIVIPKFLKKYNFEELRVDLVQDSNTCHMIFSIPDIISFVSTNFTLMPGDIILTGTPSGVGPLAHGDLVEVEIENIGVLKNHVVNEVENIIFF